MHLTCGHYARFWGYTPAMWRMWKSEQPPDAILSPTWSLTDVCGSLDILPTTVLSLRWSGGCLQIGSDRQEDLATPRFVQWRQTLANRTLALEEGSYSWRLAPAHCGHSNAPAEAYAIKEKEEITSRPSYLRQLCVLFLSALLYCSTVLCLFDYVVLFWANKYDDDDDDEGKINYSRRLKQFDSLTWLTPKLFYFSTDLWHC